MSLTQKILFLFLLAGCLNYAPAQIPEGYYKNAEGKKSAELKTALFHIIKPHTKLGYYASSTYFRTTDWNPGGYFWDMYSNIHRTSFSGMNREHNLPKSWFGVSSEQVDSFLISTDLHNLYPSDATANSAKSNFPPGVVSTSTFDNGVFKVGKNTFTGYSGNVFEPDDEYKGDFARDYMYMVTCYEDYSTRWTSLGTTSMLDRNTYPVFKSYAISLLLKWHRNDPVSDKETNRNNAVYTLQNNRNPFIDHPELAEYLWGKYTAHAWLNDGILPEEDFELVLKFNQASNTLKVNISKPTLATYYIESLTGIRQPQTGHFASDGSIQVGRLNSGMYLLVIYTGNTRKTGKFVVMH